MTPSCSRCKLISRAGDFESSLGSRRTRRRFSQLARSSCRCITAAPTVTTKPYCESLYHTPPLCLQCRLLTPYSHGVPQIILPIWFDLYNYAATAEHLGVGIWPNKDTAPDWEADALSRGFMEALSAARRPASGHCRARHRTPPRPARSGRWRRGRLL